MLRLPPRLNKRRLSNRQGAVPIEIVLAIPFLLFVLGFVFVVSSVGLTRTETATTARHHALRARHEPWRADPLDEYEIEELDFAGMDLPARMLKPGARPYQGARAERSVATNEQELPVNPILAIYQPFVSTTQFEAFVLAGVWDHREMPFREHSELTITDRATNFGLGNVSEFAALGGFGAGFSGHSGNTTRQQNARSDARGTARRELEAAVREESRLSDELSWLESQDPRDSRRIDDVRRELERIRQGIEDLQTALRYLGG